MIDWKREQAG